MNIIEASIAENHHDIFRSQHGNDSIDNRIGALLVKRRVTSSRNRIYNRLRIQSLLFRDLLQPGDLRDENPVRQF